MAVLLLGLGIWGAAEEIMFRSKAERTVAVVREWQSEKLFGFEGIAKVDLNLPTAPGFFKGRPVRTCLWYRLAPGETIPVFHGDGKPAVRLDSLWQGFTFPVLLLIGPIVWLVEIWRRPKRSGLAGADTRDRGAK